MLRVFFLNQKNLTYLEATKWTVISYSQAIKRNYELVYSDNFIFLERNTNILPSFLWYNTCPTESGYT